MRRSLVYSHPVYTLVLPKMCDVSVSLALATPGHASSGDLFAPEAATRVLQCFLKIWVFKPSPLLPKKIILIYVVAEECLVRFLRDVPRETPLFDSMSKTL